VICPHCNRDTDRPPNLSQRDLLVLDALRSGHLRSEDIAAQLGTTEQTIKNHLRRIWRILGLKKRRGFYASFGDEKNPLPDILTPQQRQIAERIIRGQQTYREIAAELNTTQQIIKNYAREIFDRVGADGRYDLAARFTANRPDSPAEKIKPAESAYLYPRPTKASVRELCGNGVQSEPKPTESESAKTNVF